MATKTVTRYRTRTVRVRGRSKSSINLPLAVLAGFVPTAAFAIQVGREQGIEGGLKAAAMRLTGYNAWVGNFYWQELAKGWGPILAGAIVHKVANRLGVNRALGAARIPFIRI